MKRFLFLAGLAVGAIGLVVLLRPSRLGTDRGAGGAEKPYQRLRNPHPGREPAEPVVVQSSQPGQVPPRPPPATPSKPAVQPVPESATTTAPTASPVPPAPGVTTTAAVSRHEPPADPATCPQQVMALLNGIGALAPSNDWAIPAALRRCRLLSELGDYAAAEAALNVAESQAKDPPWPPPVLGERIRLLIDRGDLPGARSVRDQMLEMYPDYELPPAVAKALGG